MPTVLGTPQEPSRCWVSHPQEWQPWARRWAEEFEGVHLREWPQWGGAKVVALSLGKPEARVRLLVTVPHGHEPAGTAACVDMAHQLLTGRHLDGSPSALPWEEVRRRLFVTLAPDTNPQGRSRSPERVWDGTRYDNETFLKFAFGVARDGHRFGRYPEWRFSEHQPQRVGIIYEQIGEDEWVEPNTSRRSTHSRMLDDLLAADGYTHSLELHQHESDEAVLLPADFEEMGWEEQEVLLQWAEAILAAWRGRGLRPAEKPYIPYRGQPRQEFLRAFWQNRGQGLRRLVIEVRNNRHQRTGEPTPLERQFLAAHTALEATLRWLLPLGESVPG